MVEMRILTLVFFLILSLCLGIYAWLYVRKVHKAVTNLHLEVPTVFLALLHTSSILALLAGSLSIVFFLTNAY